MDDDDKFDRWMADYERQQKLKQAKASGNGGSVMSQETYMAKHAKVYEPEEQAE